MESITGAALAAEQLGDLESEFIGPFETILLVFAGVGLLVATFSIHNTLSILGAQQARTSALMRAIGATRGQVVTATLIESLTLGILASLVGFVAGLGLTLAGLAGLDAIGAAVPGSTTWSATTVAVAVSVGVGATLVASVIPIIATSRVAPLAATRDLAVEKVDIARRRTMAGVVVGAVGLGLLVSPGASDGSAAALGWGTLALIVATVLVGPRLSRPLITTLGAPVARFRGRPGSLAVRNAVRNPRRTAGTAGALMIGVAVVTGFTVLASSASASIDRIVTSSFDGDLAVYDQAFSGPGLPTELSVEIASLPEVSTAVGMGFAVAEVDGATVQPMVTDPVALSSVFDPVGVRGNLADVDDSGVAVSESFAASRGLDLGDAVTFGFPEGSDAAVDIAAIYRETELLGDVVLTRSLWEANGGRSGDLMVFVGLAPGVDLDTGRSAVTAVTDHLGAPSPLDGEELVGTVAAEIDQALTMVYALLAIAIVIAVLGIGNTISLGIHERTRELGLLRAVGLTRPQLRSMVRWESAMIAVVGTGLGLAVGTTVSWAAVRGISANGSTVFPLTIPLTALAIIAVLGAMAGVMAGWRPAARAARADVLTAIAGE